MAIAPRSSLRSLVLVMSHRKPRVSSLFSSSSDAPSPGHCTPDAPAVQPPAAPVPPDSSSRKSPSHEESPIHPLPGPPPKKGNAVTESSQNPEQPVLFPCTVDEDPKHPAPPERSSNRCVDHEELVLPCGAAESNVADKPLLYTIDKGPKYRTPDDGPCMTIPDPRGTPKEGVKHPLPDPPPRRP